MTRIQNTAGQEGGARLRPMTKKELAIAYAPDLAIHSASNRLHQWLHHNERLMQELLSTGYVDKQRIFTIPQVQIIYRYLGEP